MVGRRHTRTNTHSSPHHHLLRSFCLLFEYLVTWSTGCLSLCVCAFWRSLSFLTSMNHESTPGSLYCSCFSLFLRWGFTFVYVFSVCVCECGKADIVKNVFMRVDECVCVCVQAWDPMSSHYGESGWPSPAPTSVSESGGAPHQALSQWVPGGEAVFCCITSHTASPPQKSSLLKCTSALKSTL